VGLGLLTPPDFLTG